LVVTAELLVETTVGATAEALPTPRARQKTETKSARDRTMRLDLGALLPLELRKEPRVASAPPKKRPRPLAWRLVDPAVDAFSWRLT
jgi:hypothetical protein